jgi:hypothetical protein
VRRPGLLGPDGGDPGGKGLLEAEQLAQEIGGAGDLQGVLQPLIEQEVFKELEDGALEGRPQLVLHRLGQAGLGLDRRQEG